MSTKALHWFDWVVFGATLAVSVAIGLYYAFSGGKQKTTKEYLMGNRQLKVIPVSLSMFMSFISAIYVLGNTAEMYLHGTQMYLQTFGSILGYLLTTIIFVPLFYPLKITSSFEYISARFNSRPLRLTMVIVLIIQQISYMGLAMYAPATALESVTGFPIWGSILLASIVTTFYTTLGGMKAVVWTDVFQGVVMFVGILLVLILGAVRVGGLGKVWEISRQTGRINFFNFDPDPTKRLTFWPLIFGRTFYTLASFGTSQAFIQRYCALPSLKKARLSVALCAVYLLILATVVGLCGLVMFAYYYDKGCDPLRGGLVKNSNQLLPYFILDVLGYPGLPGLFLAVIFSGALSSLSSSMNALSAVTWKDILESRFKGKSESYKAFITKILVVVYGAAAMGMGLFMQVLTGHVMQIANRLLGALGSPIAGVMMLGTFSPFSNAIGAIIGAITSVGFTTWINVGAYVFRPHRKHLVTAVYNCSFPGNQTAPAIPTDPPSVFPLYKLSFAWIPFVGTMTVVLVGFLISFITGRTDPSRLRPGLVAPLSNYFCCCCPESVRKFFWCGVDHTREPEPVNKEEDEEEEAVTKKEDKVNGIIPMDNPAFTVSEKIPENAQVTFVKMDNTKI